MSAGNAPLRPTLRADAELPASPATPPKPPLTVEQQAMVAQWTGLARKLARRACRHRLDVQDLLYSDALLAMCNAARTFDPAKSKPQTYFFKACLRAVNTGLARFLRKEARTEAMSCPESVEDSKEARSVAEERDGTGPRTESDLARPFGALHDAVKGLPEEQRLAVEEAMFRPAGVRLDPETKRSLNAALVRLRGLALVSEVGLDHGSEAMAQPVAPAAPADPATPLPAPAPSPAWSAEEEAWLWRFFRGFAVRGKASRERCAEAARRLGRPDKAVRRKLDRLAACGVDFAGGSWSEERERRGRLVLEAVRQGWEVMDLGTFLGEPCWVHPATNGVATMRELAGVLGLEG